MKRRDFIKGSALGVASTGKLLGAAWGAAEAPHKVYTLESKGLLLQITADGLLWEITNKHSGHSYLSQANESIWKLVLSSPVENVLSVFSSSTPGEVRANGEQIEITHATVRLRNETVPIRV